MMKDRFLKRLRKKARKGHRGWPIAMIAFYGPNLSQATKVVVGVVTSENADVVPLRDWKVDRRLNSRPHRRVYATRIRLIVYIRTNALSGSRSSHSFPLRRVYPRARAVGRNVSACTKQRIDQLHRDQRIHNLTLNAALLVGGYKSQLCGRLQGPIHTTGVSIQPDMVKSQSDFAV